MAAEFFSTRPVLELPQSNKQELLVDKNEITVIVDRDWNKDAIFYSGLASHILATLGLIYMGRFGSVMAPPANVSVVVDTFIHAKGKTFARAAKAFTHTQR